MNDSNYFIHIQHRLARGTEQLSCAVNLSIFSANPFLIAWPRAIVSELS
jgi:hypothetical protein